MGTLDLIIYIQIHFQSKERDYILPSRKKLLLVPERILLREELPIMSQFIYFRHIYLFVKPYRHHTSLLLEQSPYNEV